MTEHYSFFDAVQDSNGNYDREYNAQQFTDYFKSLVMTGVMKGAYNQLEVTANGANMITSVKSGVAFIEGRYYYNDALLELTHDTEVVALSRIDRIVIRLDLSTENRYVRAFVKKGSPSANPVAPTLTQTSTVYEISLAQVKVIGGQTYIETTAIIDERGKDIVCPWAGSKILPNFDNNFVLTELVNKADKTQEESIQFPLATGWIHDSETPLLYYKDEFGRVRLEGVVLANGGSPVVGVLPDGYRPLRTEKIPYHTTDGNVKYMIINTDGRIQSPSSLGFTISGSFRAS